MISLRLDSDTLILEEDEGTLAPRHKNQLSFLGFEREGAVFRVAPQDLPSLLSKLIRYFVEKAGVSVSLSPELQRLSEQIAQQAGALQTVRYTGAMFKEGKIGSQKQRGFLIFLKSHIPRQLKDHQIKAALHLLSVENGANFSVPGSGKTTVVLTVFEKLRVENKVDVLFVVGPPACFAPWRYEYEAVLGRTPSWEVLAGGDADTRRTKYLVNQKTACDLYLTTFQTLQRDWEDVCTMFQHQGLRFYLVVDEAHYIKQLGGEWAKAVLNIAPHATQRCILTGTPFPKSYGDAFNLFDVLWPQAPPITEYDRQKIRYAEQQKDDKTASEILTQAIDPLFYRVRKKDLGLAAQNFHDPVFVKMNPNEKLIYDSIVDRIREVSKEQYFRDINLLMRLKRGRMIRLRQCVSYTKLLGSAVEDYNEDLLGVNPALADIIKHYDELERPAKFERALMMIRDFVDKGQKVVLWANFVGTLKALKKQCLLQGVSAELIYGETPTETRGLQEELTREEIIERFVASDSGLDVLIANPAACAESISLHKACSRAIYYDLSYNCAQYLQSLDRIHRVGGSENKEAHYYFLQYEDTVDGDILQNVRQKAARMAAIIDKEYGIYSLDMFDEDCEMEAYERLFGNS